MNKVKIDKYNLHTTLLGGQAFNWDLVDDSYFGFTQDKIIELKLKGSDLYWQTYPEKDDWEFVKNYLQLELDYNMILERINKDVNVQAAVKNISHVRLLNQDFEQTLLSFILTSNKNIKAVRKIVRGLSKKYGEQLTINGANHYLFPKIEVIANLSESQLKEVGAGFRAKYLQKAAEAILNKKLNVSNSSIKYDEDKVREQLITLNGVGDKIADCVMAFSLEFYNITPIDIWGKRILTNLYGLDENLKYSEMRKWYSQYFGEYTAYAGQILFEYYRTLNR